MVLLFVHVAAGLPSRGEELLVESQPRRGLQGVPLTDELPVANLKVSLGVARLILQQPAGFDIVTYPDSIPQQIFHVLLEGGPFGDLAAVPHIELDRIGCHD